MRLPAFLLVLLLALPAPAFGQAVSTADMDGDGLTNAEEDQNQNGTVDARETDPFKADTDGGGEADGSEKKGGRDPFDPQDDMTNDRDSDGLVNGQELEIGTDTVNSDTDGDGVNDSKDPFPLEKEFTKDVDRDGMADEWETANGLSPFVTDDAALDTDSDGLTNREEFILNTDPKRMDTDRDGIDDGREEAAGSDPEESPCLAYGAEGEAQADMEGHWAAGYVDALTRTTSAGQTIVQGYALEDGRREFRPEQPVTRFEFLKMALLGGCVALKEDFAGATLPFSDTADDPAATEADRLLRKRVLFTASSHGIVQGYADGTFRPNAPVSRAEALSILMRASRLQQPATATGVVLKDVPAEAWFSPAVRLAVSLGVVRGYPDGTFGPERSITRAEAAALIARTMVRNPGVNGDVLPPLE